MYVTIQAFSVKSIPKWVIDKIPNAVKRGKTLVAYVIGQEGESTPVSLQESDTVRLSWSEKVIQAMSRMANGVKLFMGHQKGTNSNNGRPPVAEVVASYIDKIGGKMSAVIVAPFEGKPAEDVCSIEADIVTRGDKKQGFIVEAIKNLTGIAIGRGDEEAPAFIGARQIATVQCFTNTSQQENSTRSYNMEITFKDAKDFILERKVFPSQVFTVDDILADREYKGVLEQKFMNFGEVKDLKDENSKMKSELDGYRKKEGRVKGREVIEEKLKEGFTDSQKSHILRAFEKNDSFYDFSDSGIEKFIANEAKEYEYLVNTYGAPKDPNVGKTPDQIAKEAQQAAQEEQAGLEDIAAELLGG